MTRTESTVLRPAGKTARAITKSRSLAFCFLMAVSATAAVAAGVENVPPHLLTDRISPTQLASILAAVKAIPGIKCDEYVQFQYVCDSAAQRTIWIFTRQGHPAHPAYTRGTMVARKGSGGTVLGIDRSGQYAGDPVAYDHWMKEFAGLDDRQVSEWRANLSRSH